MKEIVCPHCNKVFTVDEASYASILNQVKNREFAQELEARLHEIDQRRTAEIRNRELAREQEYLSVLNQKDNAIKDRDNEIGRLRSQEEAIRTEEHLKMERQMAAMQQEVVRLKAEIERGKAQVDMARLEEQNRTKDELHNRDNEIERLKLQVITEQKTASEREQSIKNNYELQLKQSRELVDYYKDMKTRLSTKMVGESLEQHCNYLYNTTIRSILPNAYFDKDNDASEGTKGDFIFRDSEDGIEYISIMFEMKNENDDTARKHRNVDFLDKLDSDRRKKNCEYAVLVSMLESDNELYNTGIVDMSHVHEKMYVIRPQFFIPLITLLVQTSRKTIEYKRKLLMAEQQTIDVSKFEEKLENFKDAFSKNYAQAHKKFNTAIEEIDKSIKHLQEVRAALVGSEESLRKAGNETENLTIKKLTWGNKTMRKRFEEARENDPTTEE